MADAVNKTIVYLTNQDDTYFTSARQTGGSGANSTYEIASNVFGLDGNDTIYSQQMGIVYTATGSFYYEGTTIDAGNGNDTIYDRGTAKIYAGAGDDTISTQQADRNYPSTFDGSSGFDTLVFTVRNFGDFLVGSSYISNLERLIYNPDSASQISLGAAASTFNKFQIIESSSDFVSLDVYNTIGSSEVIGKNFAPNLGGNISGLIGQLNIDISHTTGNWGIGGTQYSDVIISGSGNDRIIGGLDREGGGNDIFDGGAGTDEIRGGSGNDTIIGGVGADQMFGYAGNDVYSVDNIGDVVVEAINSGYDTIYTSVSYTLPNNVEALIFTGMEDINATGNASSNVLIGNAGHNVLTGGGGDDLYGVDGNGDTVVEAAGGGYDEVYSSGNYTMAENTETLFLTGSAVYATGNASNNALIGNDLDNVIDAAGGTFEFINGASGNDLLIGGAGHDEIMGGAGNDTFRFTAVSDVFNGPTNVGDFLYDFTPGQDHIQLNAAAFGIGTASNPLVAGVSFINGSDVTSAVPTLLYTQANGTLFYDADGTGAQAPVVMAVLNGTPTLHASDFTFY